VVNGDPKVMCLKVAGNVAAKLAKIGRALADTGTPGAEETARAYFARDGQPYSAKACERCCASGYRQGRSDQTTKRPLLKEVNIQLHKKASKRVRVKRPS